MINKVFAINGRTFYEVKDENGKLLRGQEIFDYIERLEKGLDEACKRLAYENEITCMHLKQQYAWAKNKVPKTKEQIKEELMKND